MADIIDLDKAKLTTKTYLKRQVKDKNERVLLKFFMSKTTRKRKSDDGTTPDRSA